MKRSLLLLGMALLWIALMPGTVRAQETKPDTDDPTIAALVKSAQALVDGGFEPPTDAPGDKLSTAIEIALLLTIPSAVALVVIPLPLVTVLFERGAFTADDSASTAFAVAVYGLGLPAFVRTTVPRELRRVRRTLGGGGTTCAPWASFSFVSFAHGAAPTGRGRQAQTA